MNVCEPHFERRLIFDTYACRTGKGRLKAVERAQHFARGHAWYLKMDVRKYFDSIGHERMRAVLGRMCKDAAVLEVFSRIIASHETAPGRGLPIGNLTSQHFANLYLGELDLFVKGELRVHGYVRYMDDFVLWGAERKELRELRVRVEEFLRERLRLAVKPEQLNRVERGMPFLGSRLYPHRLELDGRGRRRFVAKLRHLEWEYAVGRLSGLGLQQRATALAAHTETAGGRAFRRGVLAQRDFGAAAMDEPPGSNRVLRGGSWNNNATNGRTANRNNNPPGNTNNNIGFRCVRSSGNSPQWEDDSDPAAVLSAVGLAPAVAKRKLPSGVSSASSRRAESSGREALRRACPHSCSAVAITSVNRWTPSAL